MCVQGRWKQRVLSTTLRLPGSGLLTATAVRTHPGSCNQLGQDTPVQKIIEICNKNARRHILQGIYPEYQLLHLRMHAAAHLGVTLEKSYATHICLIHDRLEDYGGC